MPSVLSKEVSQVTSSEQPSAKCKVRNPRNKSDNLDILWRHLKRKADGSDFDGENNLFLKCLRCYFLSTLSESLLTKPFANISTLTNLPSKSTSQSHVSSFPSLGGNREGTPDIQDIVHLEITAKIMAFWSSKPFTVMVKMLFLRRSSMSPRCLISFLPGFKKVFPKRYEHPKIWIRRNVNVDFNCWLFWTNVSIV